MSLSGHHETTLRKIFAHPLVHNLEWREVVSLLDNVGTVVPKDDGRVQVMVGEESRTFERPHHGHDDVLDAEQVVEVRRMLADAGITPAQGG